MSAALATTNGKQSWVAQFVDRAMHNVRKAPAGGPLSYVREAGALGGAYFQGGALGALLGATHAKWGLDAMGFPLDGATAGILALTSIALCGTHPDAALWAARRGETAFGIFTFRKSFELVGGEPMMPSGGAPTRIASAVAPKAARIMGEDPIEKVAQGL